MSRKKASPGKGRGATPDQFSYTKTPVSLKCWYAWCAGEPEWYEVHEHTERERGTKVCLEWATDGEVPCPRCRPYKTPTTCAYVPLYREMDMKSCLVICHDSVADLLEGLEFGSPVMVGRVSEDASVFVRKTDGMSRFSSALPGARGRVTCSPRFSHCGLTRSTVSG